MFEKINYSEDLEKNYNLVLKQIESLCQGVEENISILSNASALLNQFLKNINWVGFYLYQKESKDLILGPFQGLPACTKIKHQQGVCGFCASSKNLVNVDDVNLFPGHIACDSRSKSELVIPIILDFELYGVLDIDSPLESRFTLTDEKYLQEFVNILCKYLKRP